MLTCPKCNNELNDDMKFCDRCGASVTEIPGEEMPTAAPVEETVVEAPVQEMPEAVPAEETTEGAPIEETAEAAPVKKTVEAALAWIKQIPKKTLMTVGAGVAAVVVVVMLFSLIFGGKANNYGLYLKDEEIFYSDLKKNSDAWQVTSRLADSDYIDAAELASERYTLADYTYISEDGKYIFFVDKLDGGDGANLYYRQVGKDKEAVKIDSDVRVYTVNESASVVTYTKGSSRDLYQYQVGKDEKEKVAKDLTNFAVSKDGKKIIYQNDEGTLYLKSGKEDKEKIASDISNFEYVSEDYKTVYYTKDESLYKQVIGKDKEEIASDVASVLRVYESGEVYYLTNAEGEISLMDYVDDDMKSADASITKPVDPVYPEAPVEPDEPDYPYSWHYDTTEEYEAAVAAYDAAYAAYEEAVETYKTERAAWEDECDRIDTEYDNAWDMYYAKANRDELRESLKEATMDTECYSLCYYNGKESVVITDACENWTSYSMEVPVLIYEAYSQSDVSKVKLSEVEYVSDIYDMVEEALYTETESFIAVEGTATAVDEEKDATCFRVNKEGTQVFYIDDIPDDEDHGTLYTIEIKKGKPGKAEVYDEDVYTSYCYFTETDSFMYFKDYKDGKGELYVDKEKVDYDVRSSGVTVEEDGDVIYFTDWNDEKDYGTLKIFEGKEPEKISDDASSYVVTPDGRVMYLYDYSKKYHKGELHVWDNGKSRKVDEDVIAILPIVDYEQDVYRGNW